MSNKKDMLKVGYVVELKNGDLLLVFPLAEGNYLIHKSGSYMPMDELDDNLCHIWPRNPMLDIEKIYNRTNISTYALSPSTIGRELVWSRKENKNA